MAPLSKALVLSGALFAALSSAAPLRRRDVVWETVTDVVWTTVDITTTIYPGQATAQPAVFAVTTEVSPPSIPTHPSVAPAPSSSSSSQTSSTATPAQPSVTTTIVPPPVVSVPAPVTSDSPPAAAPAPAPATTSTTTTFWTPTPSPAPTASLTSSGSSTSGSYDGVCDEVSPCIGDGTYYQTATTMTNPSFCDTANNGNVENVLALPVALMDQSYCGKTVTIKYNGVTATATVVDKCMGCDATSIDMSEHLFQELAPLSVGRLHGVDWFVN